MIVSLTLVDTRLTSRYITVQHTSQFDNQPAINHYKASANNLPHIISHCPQWLWLLPYAAITALCHAGFVENLVIAISTTAPTDDCSTYNYTAYIVTIAVDAFTTRIRSTICDCCLMQRQCTFIALIYGRNGRRSSTYNCTHYCVNSCTHYYCYTVDCNACHLPPHLQMHRR